jgi:hypothetical protein
MRRWKISSEYEIREMVSEEFRPFLIEHRPSMFFENFSCYPDDILSDDEMNAQKKLASRMGELFYLRLGVFHLDKQIGWSFGVQIDRGKFYMVNSAIFPEHRKKGLYSALLKSAVEVLIEQGFQLITSSHIATNSAIIVAKLKAGFIITGFEMSDTYGLMVNLTYYTNPTRRKIMDFRSGLTRPDGEMRKLFGL